MKKNYIIVLLLFLIFQICYAQETETSTVDLDLPNRIGAFKIPSLGMNQLEVYKNKDNEYFYQPILLPNWELIKNEIDKLNGNEDDVFEIPITLDFINANIEQEILTAINLKGGTASEITTLPHTFYKITAKVGGVDIIINPDDLPSLKSGYKLQRQKTIVSPQEYYIKAKLKDLKEFYEKRGAQASFSGIMFSQGFAYNVNYVRGIAKFGSVSNINTELFGDEKKIQETIVKSSSSSSGLSLNLGDFSFASGSGKTGGTTKQINQRIVNRNYLNDIVSKYSVELELYATGNKEETKELINSFTGTLLELLKETEVRFNKLEDGNYQIISDVLGYSTIGKEKVKEILNYKPDFDYKSESNPSVEYAGIKASDKKSTQMVYSGGIEWQRDGENWIPSKAKMYIMSKTDLLKDVKLEAVIENKKGDRATAVKFVFPAYYLKNLTTKKESITDKDNPIGSILPFAGDSTKIPQGWQLCDGKFLKTTGYESLFNIIGYKWGKNENNDFKLPNLQGQFLRGVDYSKQVDPDVEKRRNSLDEIGEVGSYQNDEIIKHFKDSHSHTDSGGTVDDCGGCSNKGTYIRFSNKPTNEIGGNETRPKNAYVNFIIRVK